MKKLQITNKVLGQIRAAFAPIMAQVKEHGYYSELPQMKFGYSCNIYQNRNGRPVLAVKVDGGVQDEDGNTYVGFKIGGGRGMLAKYLPVSL